MSDAGQILSRAERFRRKGVECRQIADSAKLPQTKVIFANLAQSYRRLAMHEERLEEVIGRSVGAPAKHQSRLNDCRPKAEKKLLHLNGEVDPMRAKGRHHPVASFVASSGAAFRLFLGAIGGGGQRSLPAEKLRASAQREGTARPDKTTYTPRTKTSHSPIRPRQSASW